MTVKKQCCIFIKKVSGNRWVLSINQVIIDGKRHFNQSHSAVYDDRGKRINNTIASFLLANAYNAIIQFIKQIHYTRSSRNNQS